MFHQKVIAWGELFTQHMQNGAPFVAEAISICHNKFVLASPEGSKMCIGRAVRRRYSTGIGG
jgi:hypothetical protein